MRYPSVTFGALASLGLLVGLATATPAQVHPDNGFAPSGFRRIEQPLWAKALVTGGGLGLVGLELWWFLVSKPKASLAQSSSQSNSQSSSQSSNQSSSGLQEITVTVDGGYDPSHIVVRAGQPVRLNFYRTDRSSCLSEVRLPDFRIAKTLPVNQTTPVEFTPEAGRYEFACGMNMFRGTVEAVADSEASPPNRSSSATQSDHGTFEPLP